MRILTMTALAVLLATPLAAQTFKAQNGLQVTAAAQGFAVDGDRGRVHGPSGVLRATMPYAARARAVPTSVYL